ncbi:MAG: acyl-CoA dehydrogenase family protein [Actinobacteria bacterium]|nr:acyl-CoA dehydrogenase family protein [Actinomycetota bacterium]
MDFDLPDHLPALAAEAREVGRAGAARRERTREDGWLVGHDPTFALELAERGWLGMTWPVSAGGGGRSALERFVVFEALIGEGAPLASAYFADRQIGPTLLQFGTEEQQARWLPGILAGTAVWCIGMSEPDAGSDVASLRTRAEPDGSGGWVVSGAKVWTSGAALADWCYLVARTDPDAPPHAGLSELVVDLRAPGVEIRPIADQSGGRHFCEVRFDGVRVPGHHLVGTPNGSFRQIMRQMEHERGGIDRLVSNHRLYRDCRPFTRTDDPRVRQEVAALESGYRLGRLLVLREVLGQAPPSFSAATKTFCTEHEQRVAAFCTRVLGPAAQAWPDESTEESAGPAAGAAGAAGMLAGTDHLAERVARNAVYAPAYTLMGGTTQILRTILADRTLTLPRA